jgi:hypothetical protein
VKKAFHFLQKTIGLFLIFGFIALILLSPIASNTSAPNISDLFNHLAAIAQAKVAWIEGQFPLRISPTEQSGWRYPLFQFYSPTSYAVAGLIYKYITIANPFIAYKITLWFALLMGGIYMSRLANQFVHSKYAAILAGVVYLTSPHLMVLIGHMAAFNEALGMGLLPVVLFYAYQRYQNPFSVKSLLLSGLSWYLLITIHLITFFYTSFFVALLLMLITFQNKQWSNLLGVGVGYAFGCLLAMWYLAPAALLGKYLLVHQSIENLTVFSANIPSLPYLFSPFANFSFGILSTIATTHPALGLPILIAAGICIYAATQKQLDILILFVLIVFLSAFILTWSPINFWRWLPSTFMLGQYSWRLMSQLSWLGALLFAWSVCWLFHSKLDKRHVILGILLLLMATSSWLPVNERAQTSLASFIKKPALVFNVNSYSLNMVKYPGFVSEIDRMQLDSLITNNKLDFAGAYLVPKELLQYALKPYVFLKGKLKSSDKTVSSLELTVNGKLIATHTLNNNQIFDWKIPLPLEKNHEMLLHFQIKNAPKNVGIEVNQLFMGGFQNPSSTMDANELQKVCQQQQTTTLCRLNVNSNIHLIELPILYYPQLLEVTVNDHPVAYKSVQYADKLIAAIVPPQAGPLIIKVKFTGLKWANAVSWLAWGMLFILFLMSFKKKNGEV